MLLREGTFNRLIYLIATLLLCLHFTFSNAQDYFVICPDDISVANESNVCGATVNYELPVGSDNLGNYYDVTLLNGLGSGSFYPVGFTLEEYGFDAPDGSQPSCSFIVEVRDTESPVIPGACASAPAINYTAPGLCIAYVQISDAVYTDNCGQGLNISYDFDNNGSTDHFGSNPIQVYQPGTTTSAFVVSDSYGKSAGCTFTVTVADGEAPNAVCNDIAVTLNNGTASVDVNDIDGGSADNCDANPVSAITGGLTSYTNADEDQFFDVELTVTDDDGNAGTCLASVYVNPIKPVWNQNCDYDTTLTGLCPENLIFLDNGIPLIQNQDLYLTSQLEVGDDLNTVSFFFGDLVGGCVTDDATPVQNLRFIVADLIPGQNTCPDVLSLGLTAEDDDGNVSDIQYYNFTVIDDLPPFIETLKDHEDNLIPVTYTLEDYGYIADDTIPCLDYFDDTLLYQSRRPIDLSMDDNCVSGIIAEPIVQYNIDSTAITRFWEFVDECGNMTTIEQLIHVIDTEGICESACDTQSITIPSGWSTISSYVIPDQPDMLDVISEVASDVIIIKDAAGNIVLPSFGFNQIGSWDITQGYQVKAENATVLEQACTRVSPESQPIFLDQGWSIIAYLRDNPMDAVSALSNLTPEDIIIVKDDAGNIYLPAFGFNQIGDMLPGKGYQIKMLDVATLVYPPNSARVSGSTYTEPGQNTRYIVDKNTGNNATIFIPEGTIEGLQPGDEVGVFSRTGELVGAAVYQGGHLGLAVWGNDASLEEDVNLEQGEPYRFKVWRPSEQSEYDMIAEYREGNPFFSTNGISILSNGTVPGWKDVPTVLQPQVFVYPNPTRNKLTIDILHSEAGEARWSVYDLTGRQVGHQQIHELQAGHNLIEVDVAAWQAWEYFYRLETRGEVFNGGFVKVE